MKKKNRERVPNPSSLKKTEGGIMELSQDQYNNEVAKISLSDLPVKDKIDQIENLKKFLPLDKEVTDYLGSDVKIDPQLKRYFTKERVLDRQKRAKEAILEINEENKEKAGSLIEIFDDYITVNEVSLPKPTHQFLLLIDKKFGDLSKAIYSIYEGDTVAISYCIYVLIHTKVKDFYKKYSLEELENIAWDWYNKHSLQEQIALRDTLIVCIDSSLEKKKKKMDYTKPITL